MKYQWLLLGTCFLGLSFTSGCSQDHPGNVANKRLEIHQEEHVQEFTSHNLSQSDMKALSIHHKKYSNGGPVNVMVQYDPTSSLNTAMNATNHASKIAKGLREAGISSVKTQIMPVNGVGDHSKTLITYDKFTAHAPEGCDVMMPGTNNTATDWKANKEYQYGCTVEATIAKQIARPSDLLGNSKLGGEGDGRRAGNIVDTYRYGEPNQPLEGESASNDE